MSTDKATIAKIRNEAIGLRTLYCGDCLEVMATLPDTSIDLVLCDLPYGTTQNKWDSVIPLDTLWANYLRVAKSNAAIVLTASQPFTAALVMSRPDLFKHEWVWIKNRGANFANTVREPMKEHESVLVFSRGRWTYNMQMQERTGSGLDRVKYGFSANISQASSNYGATKSARRPNLENERVPSTWQKFNCETGLHPTQKPVALMEYLIRTYSNPEDTVLDNCMGSGTTGVACANTNRRFIGIERDPDYFELAKTRIQNIPNDMFRNAI